jgi:putative transposase
VLLTNVAGPPRWCSRSGRSLLQEYEIWLQLVRGETTIAEAADRFEVDRSTIVRRVLEREGLRLRPLPRPGRSVRKPFPDWVEHAPTRSGSTTPPTSPGRAWPRPWPGDLVSRKWLAEIVSAEETSTLVQVVFTDALEREGLLDRVSARQGGLVDPTVDDPARPVLLALSDNRRR